MADQTKSPPQPSRFVELGGLPWQTSGPSQAESAVKAGGSVMSPQSAASAEQAQRDLSYVDQNWGTAGQLGLGALSGLTLGLGPGLAARAGLLDPGHIQAAQVSPWYTAGDIGGMLLPAVASGGESLVGRGLAITPAGLMTAAGGLSERLAAGIIGETPGLLGRLASAPVRLAAQGATEGALINVGHTIGDNLVQNKPLTAEAILASGADGALFGGLVGGSLGAFGAVAEAGVEAVSKSGLGSKLAGKGIRAETHVSKSLGIESEEQAAMSAKGTLRDTLKSQNEVLERGGSRVGDTVPKKLDASRSVAKIDEAIRADAVEQLEKLAHDMAPSVERVFGRIEGDLAKYNGSPAQLTAAKETAEVRKRLETVMSDAPMSKADYYHSKSHAEEKEARKAWKETPPSAKAAEYDSYAREFHSQTADWKQWVNARDLISKEFNGQFKAEILNAIDSEITGAMQGAADFGDGLKGIAEKYGAATQSASIARQMEAALGKKLTEQLRSTSGILQPTDFGAAAGMTAIGHPAAAAGWMASKGIGRILQKRIEPWLGQMAYDNMFGVAGATQTMSAQSKIKSSLKKFFKSATKAPVYTAQGAYANRSKEKSSPYSRDSYEAAAARTEQLLSQAHYDRVQRHLNGLVAQGYPDLAAAMAGVNQRAVQYLMWNQPASKSANSINSLRQKPKSISLDMDEFKFLRIEKGIKSPLSILDDLESGAISRDAVQAMRYTYPELHGEIVASATEEIYNAKLSGEYLPMDKIANLSVLLDAPLDTTMEPEYINAVQVALNVPTEQLTGSPTAEPPPAQPIQTMQGQGFLTPLQATSLAT